MKKIMLGLAGFFFTTQTFAFALTSPVLKEETEVPKLYIAPSLTWSGAPKGTKTFALIVDDPDAPTGVWTHWVVYNIPATTNQIAQGGKAGLEGLNSWNNMRYNGPCPPYGTHHYRFTLFALDKALALPKAASKEELQKAMQGAIIGTAQLTTLYSKH
jgi:Raf kinase inhibitor-like YbhB/YbcL family protein